MASSLILHKRITTTVAKAKSLRVYVEPLITKSKNDSTHSRRMVFGYLKNKYAVSELFRDVAQKIAERPGGYTRILKTGARLGDNADMCIIELVDYNENMLAATKESKPAAKRSRRGRGRKSGSTAEAQASAGKEKSVDKETDQSAFESSPKKKEPSSEKVSKAPVEDKKETVSDVKQEEAKADKKENAAEEKKEETKAEKKEAAAEEKKAASSEENKEDAKE